jgi:hypothetical protein
VTTSAGRHSEGGRRQTAIRSSIGTASSWGIAQGSQSEIARRQHPIRTPACSLLTIASLDRRAITGCWSGDRRVFSSGISFDRGWRLSSIVGYPFRIQAFARQQMVEPIGRIQAPGRAPDRNFITVRRELAGEYHCYDGSGPDIHGVMIVFCRFDDECHDPKLLFERPSLNRKPTIQPVEPEFGLARGRRCAPNCARNSIMYWRK